MPARRVIVEEPLAPARDSPGGAQRARRAANGLELPRIRDAFDQYEVVRVFGLAVSKSTEPAGALDAIADPHARRLGIHREVTHAGPQWRRLHECGRLVGPGPAPCVRAEHAELGLAVEVAADDHALAVDVCEKARHRSAGIADPAGDTMSRHQRREPAARAAEARRAGELRNRLQRLD